jgi:hypothetical protein
LAKRREDASGDFSQTFSRSARSSTDEQTNSLSYGTGYSIDTHAQTYYLQDQLTEGAQSIAARGRRGALPGIRRSHDL